MQGSKIIFRLRRQRQIALNTLTTLVLALSATGVVFAQALGTASGYNVYTLGNDYDSSDAGGAVAAAGNATFSGYSIGDDLSKGSANNLVVGGSLNATYGSVNGSVYANTMSWSDPTVNGNIDANSINMSGYGTVTGTVTYSTSFTQQTSEPTTIDGGIVKSSTTLTSPINFSSTNNSLLNDSAQWGSILANGTTSENANGMVTMTGTSKSLNVFYLSTSQLAGNTFVVNAPAGSTVLINIAGTNDTWEGNLTLEGGVTDNDVIYNFDNATSLYLDGIDIQGTLLAPSAAITGSGDIYGNLIVGTNNSSEEANYYSQGTSMGDLFAGTLPNGGQMAIVPEPAADLSLILALTATGLLVVRRRGRSVIAL